MNYTVLIADDDDDVRLLLRVVLGHEPDFTIVEEAATPDEAITKSEQLQPDVVIIDHEFRGYSNGTDAAPHIRDKCPNTVIIMFSAYDQIRNDVSANPSIDGFVLKTDVSLLPGHIRTLLAIPNFD